MFGVQEDQIRELASEGQISFRDLEEAFENMTTAGGPFENMMLSQSGTLNGMRSNLQDLKDTFMRTVGGITATGELIPGGMLDTASQGLQGLLGDLNSSESVINDFATRLSQIGGEAIKGFGDAATTTKDAVRAWWEESEGFVREQVQILKQDFMNLKDEIDILSGATDDQSQSFMDLVNTGIKAVVDVLTGGEGGEGLIGNFGELINLLSDKTTVEEMATAIETMASALNTFNDAVEWYLDKKDQLEEIAEWTRTISTLGGNKLVGGFLEAQDGESNVNVVQEGERETGNTIGNNNNKAVGGMASGWTIVGEKGPELVNLPSGSSVKTNEDTGRILGSNSPTINVNVGSVDSDRRVQQIIDAVKDSLARENRLNQLNIRV